jgi:hypothetical protein
MTKGVMTGKRMLNGCRISVESDHYHREFQSYTINDSPTSRPSISRTLARLPYERVEYVRKADEGPRNKARTSRSPVTEMKIRQEEEKSNRGPEDERNDK